MILLRLNIIFIISFFWYNFSAQIVCSEVSIVPNTPVQKDFLFSSIRQYEAGLVYHGVAKIKIDVKEDINLLNDSCKWKLTLKIDNGHTSGTGTPIDEWETIHTYGNVNNPPPINILEFRVTNVCQTTPVNGVYTFFSNDGDEVSIIEESNYVPAGSCSSNTNGYGSFLTNYDEFVFDFDLKIKPGLNYDPGYYALQLVFVLEEDP